MPIKLIDKNKKLMSLLTIIDYFEKDIKWDGYSHLNFRGI